MKAGDQGFWDEEVGREAESGRTVLVGRNVPLEASNATGWISVEKKLPPNACLVLAWEGDEQFPGCVIASYYYLTGGWVSDVGGTVCEITHWQPLSLPPPAKESGK